MATGELPYRNRRDAGRVLAISLEKELPRDTVVFAIPRGGIPVAVEVALRLGLAFDIVVPRKITIPGNTEAGYGAVTEDGAIVLNEPLAARVGLSQSQVEGQAREVMAEIGRRLSLYRTQIAARAVAGKTAVVIDDGLASGFTMLAAVKSMRQRGASRVIAAAPVASSVAYDLVATGADRVITPVVSSRYPFAVAAFYRNWYDLTDDDVADELARYGRAKREDKR